MGLNKRNESNKVFATIISDGSIRVKVDEGTPEAVRRDYKTPSGDEGFKYELVYNSIDGVMNNLRFDETDYGKMLNIGLEDERGETVVLVLNVETNFAQDFMQKLPNIDLTKSIRIAPYSIQNDNGKTNKGVSVYQDNNKIEKYFVDKQTKKVKDGFPVTEEAAQYDKDDWKIYFTKVKKFLVKYTEENIIPKFSSLNTIDASIDNISNFGEIAKEFGGYESQYEEIDPSKIPF